MGGTRERIDNRGKVGGKDVPVYKDIVIGFLFYKDIRGGNMDCVKEDISLSWLDLSAGIDTQKILANFKLYTTVFRGARNPTSAQVSAAAGTKLDIKSGRGMV